MNPYFQPGRERAFGTWPLKGAELTAALETALDVGYRAIDTAQLYGNEAEVVAALSCAKRRRERREAALAGRGGETVLGRARAQQVSHGRRAEDLLAAAEKAPRRVRTLALSWLIPNAGYSRPWR